MSRPAAPRLPPQGRSLEAMTPRRFLKDGFSSRAEIEGRGANGDPWANEG